MAATQNEQEKAASTVSTESKVRQAPRDKDEAVPVDVTGTDTAPAPAPISLAAGTPVEIPARALAPMSQPPPPAAVAASVDLNAAAPAASSVTPQVERAPPIRTPEQALLAMGGPALSHSSQPRSLQMIVAAQTSSLTVDDTPKRRPHQGPRTALTLAQKKAICQQARAEPDMKQEELAQWAVQEFGLRSLARNTVANVLKDWQRWEHSVTNGQSSAKRIRPGAHPELEAALKLYVNTRASMNETVKLPELREKARELASKMNIENWRWSLAWCDRMRKRQKILVSLRRQRTDEPEQPDLRMSQQLVIDATRKLGIHPCDVYNFDETGLLYRAQPSKSDFAPGPDGSRPPGMERITVAFMCNSDGTEIQKPLVVGPPNRPGSFGNTFDPSKHVHYFSAQDARMTSGIFNTWLADLDKKMQVKKRKVAIIVDNAACHRVTIVGALELALGPIRGVQLPSGAVTLIYLPHTTPPSAQPLERGVMQIFKVRYRRRLMEWTLARWERLQSQSRPGGLTALTQLTPPGSQLALGSSQGTVPGRAVEREEMRSIRPSLRDAVTWIGIIWVEMDEALIEGAWKKSGMVAVDPSEEGEEGGPGEVVDTETPEERVTADVQLETQELRPLMDLMAAQPDDLLEPDQYAALPEEVISGPMNDDELLREVGFTAAHTPDVPALEAPPGAATPAAAGQQAGAGDVAMGEGAGERQGGGGAEGAAGAQTPSQAAGASTSQTPSQAQTPLQTPGSAGYGMGAAAEAEGSGESLPASLVEAEQASARLLAFVEENAVLFEPSDVTLREICGVNRAFQRAIVQSVLLRSTNQTGTPPPTLSHTPEK